MSNLYEAVLAHAMKPAEENEDDYRVNGILYCGKCKTAKEMAIQGFPNPSETRVVRILCKCEEARLDAEAQEQKKHERALRIDETMQALERIGAIDAPKNTFGESDCVNVKNEQTMRKYAERFEVAFKENIGMLLSGKKGSGKTFYAQCIANELMDRGYMVMYTSMRLLADVPKDEKAFVMNCVKKCDLLILDDLCAERDTEYMAEKTFEVINARYEAKKPMIITTNIGLEDMGAEEDLKYSRIFQRVLEMCKPIVIVGSGRRMAASAEKAAAWKRLME